MTTKELSQLYHLNLEIREETERLNQLKAAAGDTSVKISGLPHTAGISNKTAIAAEIADCRNTIEAKIQAAVAEYNRLIRYIASVDDSLMRRILELRYVDGKAWWKVAYEIGGNNTADSTRKAVTRFLEKM